MFYAFITLLLLAGAYLLKLERDIVIAVVGVWTVVWFGIRLLEIHLDRVKQRQALELDKLTLEMEKWLGSLAKSSAKAEKKWQEFCRRIASSFKYDVALVQLRDRDRFVPYVACGIDTGEIEDDAIPGDSDLVASLEAGDGAVDLRASKWADSGLETLVSKYGIREAYPLKSEAGVGGIMFLGSDSDELFADKQESILAICRLAGKHLLTASGGRRGEDSPPYSPDGVSAMPAVSGYSQYFEIASKLHKIYNEELLLETFSTSLTMLFHSDFCLLCLPIEGSSELGLNVMSGTGSKDLAGRTIEGESAVFDFLVRRPGAYPVKELLELTGNDPDLEFLHQHGVELVAPVTVFDKRVALMGLPKGHGVESAYGSRDREMVFALCQTLELVLGNIQQFRKIEELSYTDSMTRLYNYRYFYKRLSEEILRAKRFNRNLALTIFDLDDFKVFNDSYGHQTGDHLLRQLGRLLLDSVRSIDIVCRYGGEEFCVIMPESDEISCVQFMERLRLKVADHEFRNRFSDERHTTTVSAGGGIFPADARRVDRLIYCADMALLEAKRQGKNVCRMFSQLRSEPESGVQQ
jgi:diguanylate cyclase (GGDEF)-like protein